MNRKSSFFAALLILWHASANAYIDPNSGSLLYQLLLPLLVAVAAGWTYLKHAILNFWARIARALGIRPKE